MLVSITCRVEHKTQLLSTPVLVRRCNQEEMPKPPTVYVLVLMVLRLDSVINVLICLYVHILELQRYVHCMCSAWMHTLQFV